MFSSLKSEGAECPDATGADTVTTTLDQIVEELSNRKPDVIGIKLDIEGFELERRYNNCFLTPALGLVSS